MTKIFLPLLCLALLLSPEAQAKKDPAMAADQIPFEYQNNVNAVVRESLLDLEVISPGKINARHKKVITIFKEAAYDLSVFVARYDDLSRISSVNIEVYDKNGKRVRRASASEIQDYSAISGFSIFSDNRVKYYEPDYKNYPFTIVYSYENTHNSAYYLPSWTPHEEFGIPVLKSVFRLKTPSELKVHFREQHMPDIREETNEEDNLIYQWVYYNYIPEGREPFAPPLLETLPFVFLAPTSFEMKRIEGDLSDWESFGTFLETLNKDRQTLPEQTREEVKDLISGVEDDFEKVKRIYEYMQNRTRYVNVKVGIGGLQPLDAQTVDELKYGDCKALSNYTRALLQVAGIKSNYSIVRMGSSAPPVREDFPSHQFNHVILAVPLDPDTVWLECTSQHLPCGYLGTATDDRLVLMADEGKGKLVRTPVYDEHINTNTSEGEITLDQHGNATANCRINYRGAYYDNYVGLIRQDDEDQRKSIIRILDIPLMILDQYKLEEQKSLDPSLQNNVTFQVSRYATTMGNRLFVPLTPLNKLTDVPRKLEQRDWPVEIRRGNTTRDSWQFNIPDGYEVEALPENVDVKTPFGRYTFAVELKDRQIHFSRELVFFKGTHKPETYDAFRDFLAMVARTDQKKCVLKKN